MEMKGTPRILGCFPSKRKHTHTRPWTAADHAWRGTDLCPSDQLLEVSVALLAEVTSFLRLELQTGWWFASWLAFDPPPKKNGRG